jgi:hypothetical protein
VRFDVVDIALFAVVEDEVGVVPGVILLYVVASFIPIEADNVPA